MGVTYKIWGKTDVNFSSYGERHGEGEAASGVGLPKKKTKSGVGLFFRLFFRRGWTFLGTGSLAGSLSGLSGAPKGCVKIWGKTDVNCLSYATFVLFR